MAETFWSSHKHCTIPLLKQEKMQPTTSITGDDVQRAGESTALYHSADLVSERVDGASLGVDAALPNADDRLSGWHLASANNAWDSLLLGSRYSSHSIRDGDTRAATRVTQAGWRASFARSPNPALRWRARFRARRRPRSRSSPRKSAARRLWRRADRVSPAEIRLHSLPPPARPTARPRRRIQKASARPCRHRVCRCLRAVHSPLKSAAVVEPPPQRNASDPSIGSAL